MIVWDSVVIASIDYLFIITVINRHTSLRIYNKLTISNLLSVDLTVFLLDMKVCDFNECSKSHQKRVMFGENAMLSLLLTAK